MRTEKVKDTITNMCNDCREELQPNDILYVILPESAPMPIMWFAKFYCEKCFPKHKGECDCLDCYKDKKIIKYYNKLSE